MKLPFLISPGIFHEAQPSVSSLIILDLASFFFLLLSLSFFLSSSSTFLPSPSQP